MFQCPECRATFEKYGPNYQCPICGRIHCGIGKVKELLPKWPTGKGLSTTEELQLFGGLILVASDIVTLIGCLICALGWAAGWANAGRLIILGAAYLLVQVIGFIGYVCWRASDDEPGLFMLFVWIVADVVAGITCLVSALTESVRLFIVAAAFLALQLIPAVLYNERNRIAEDNARRQKAIEEEQKAIKEVHRKTLEIERRISSYRAMDTNSLGEILRKAGTGADGWLIHDILAERLENGDIAAKDFL